MGWKLYFLLGDILASAGIGTASAWLASTVIPADWSALIAMPVGMVGGGIVGLVGATVLTPLFGAFEVLIPGSLSGMVAGMAFAGTDTMAGTGWTEPLGGGALIGVACLMATYVLQHHLRGEVR